MPPSPPPSLRQRFARLTALNILANLTVPLAGLVDTAMLGHLDDVRFLAGVALASILFDYLYWTLGFLRMGTTGVTAQAVGAEAAGSGEARQVHLALYRSLTLGLGLGALLLLLQTPLAAAGFAVLSGTPGVEAAGRDYFAARIWGAPAVLANFALIGWFLGREQSGRVLLVTTVGNLANIVLNYLLIVRLGLAARGAGWATAASQGLMLAVAAALVLAGGRLLPWRWHEVLDRAGLGRLARLNGDLLLRSLLLVTSFAVFTNLSALLGTVVLAANSILMRLFQVAAYLVDGVAFATESLAGIFRGSGDAPSFRRLVRLAMATGVGLAALFLAVVLIFEGPVLKVLTSHGDVLAVAGHYAPWLVPTLLLGAVAFVYDGVFLGLTEGRVLRNNMLVATGAVFVPLAVVAARTGSVHLLWAALAAFMAARALTLHLAGRRVFPRPAPAPAPTTG